MRNMLRIAITGVLAIACGASALARPQEHEPAATTSATNPGGPNPSTTNKPPKVAPPKKPATGCDLLTDATALSRSRAFSIPLGALSGTDADALAQTLSTVFHGQYIVTACADAKKDDSSSQPASPAAPGADSSGSSKHTLMVQAVGKSTVKACPLDASRCAFDAVEGSLDRDNFSGGVLNSNFVVHIEDKDFAIKLSNNFLHPVPDIDVERAVDDHEAKDCVAECERGCKKQTAGACEKECSDDCKESFKGRGAYLILVPSSLVVKQSATLKTLGEDAAGLKQDFERLSKRFSTPVPSDDSNESRCFPAADPSDSEQIKIRKIKDAEQCFADYTVMLSVLDPRDVALQAKRLFDDRVAPDPQVFPLNHSVVLLPASSRPNSNQTAAAIEQFELYQQDQKQSKLTAMLQSSSGAGTPATGTPVTTTVTSTTKTSLPAASGKTNPSSTTSTSTTTSTITQPSAQAGAGAGSGATGAAAAPSSQSAGGASSSSAGGSSSGSAGGAGSGGGQTSGGQAQPAQPTWGIDNIVHLYHYRDAAGIATAINGMVSYVPNSRPIVAPLSDFGANDMLEILPTAAAQGGYTIGDIERAISLLDLPRPQLSLQVWSYQISAKVENPNKPYSRGGDSPDAARCVLNKVNRRVDEANLKMTKALQAGMHEVFKTARGAAPNGFFDEHFREYLTERYSDCIKKDRYCLGYFTALEYPDVNSTDTGQYVAGASLGRLLLFLAAATDAEAKDLAPHIVDRMQAELGKPCPSDSCAPCGSEKCPHAGKPGIYFSRVAEELNRITLPGNLSALRAAFLDFFFNYKWTLNYPNDFVPYDLRRSAHVLDDLLQPIINAFNADIDEYVQDNLDDPGLICKTEKAGLISQGRVQVAALSGTQAFISGQVSNYFNITQTPSLSEVAQGLLAASSSGGGSGSGNGSAGGGGASASGAGGATQGSGTAGASGGKGGGGTSSGGSASSALQGLISTNPYVVGGEALAAILAPPKVTAELTKGVTLTVTPTSLDTASSAELTVNLLVNEPDGGPQSVNSTATKQDLLDRVASHQVTDVVRVQSLKLFDLSTLSMEITHPQTPTCVPLAEDQPGRTFSYIAAVPFSVPCAVWRSVFGSIPVAGRLFEWPRAPITVDNRSVAIIRATVVPTAMDFGEALTFEDDRIADPVTNSTIALSSTRQIGWRPT